jgi:hypothetical protein
MHNAENTLRVLDQFLIEMSDIRDAIASQDEKELQKHLAAALEGRQQWLEQRMVGKWEEKPANQVALPGAGDVFGRMFGIRPKKEKR